MWPWSPLNNISIHALLAESDRSPTAGQLGAVNFYPRSPCGERPAHFAKQIHSVGISIHALLAESDHYGWSWYDDFTISIHALLAESDRPRLVRHGVGIAISIHALLAESDNGPGPADIRQAIFLSTLSLRRATNRAIHKKRPATFLSTLSLRRATGCAREEKMGQQFLSTLSLRRATAASVIFIHGLIISIHALLAESDTMPGYICGTRKLFLSTLSLRRATN